MSEGQMPAGPRWTRARVGVALAVVAAWVVAAVLVSRHGGGTSDAADAGPTVPSSESVQYLLWGTATGADLTWSTGGGQVSQAMGKAVPLMTKDGANGLTFSAPVGASLYFSAQNTGEVGDLTCAIMVDGKVVARNTSSGGYSIVECTA